jgi:hypothetical protein
MNPLRATSLYVRFQTETITVPSGKIQNGKVFLREITFYIHLVLRQSDIDDIMADLGFSDNAPPAAKGHYGTVPTTSRVKPDDVDSIMNDLGLGRPQSQCTCDMRALIVAPLCLHFLLSCAVGWGSILKSILARRRLRSTALFEIFVFVGRIFFSPLL